MYDFARSFPTSDYGYARRRPTAAAASYDAAGARWDDQDRPDDN